MPITIRGVRITSITVSREDDGQNKVSASYQLISSTDKVLAKETLTSRNEYGSQSVFLPPSDTLKALASAVEKYKADVEAHLGLTD